MAGPLALDGRVWERHPHVWGWASQAGTDLMVHRIRRRRRSALAALIACCALAALLPAGAGSSASPPAAAKLQAAGVQLGLDPAVAGRLEGPLAQLLARAAEIVTAGRGLSASGLQADPDVAALLASRAVRLDAGARVQVDARISGDGPAADALRRLGVEVERHRPDLGRAQYRVPILALGDLAVLPGVRYLLAPTYGISAAGSLTTQGDDVLGAAAVRAARGLDGAGVRIGVISDGILGLAQSQASDDAPAISDFQAFSVEGINAGAEGTAMIEIIHDLAPGAEIAFANAATDLDMIEAVDYLAARTDIVVDDLSFFFPDDQMSAVSRNTAEALNHPEWPIRAYFTAIGNWSLRHYEGGFRAGPDGLDVGLPFSGAVHEFRAGNGVTDALGRGPLPYNEIYLDTGDSAHVVLFWDDRWGNAGNDYDVYLLDAAGAVVAESALGQGSGVNVPRERFIYTNGGDPGMFRVVVHNFEDRAAARDLELFVFESPQLPGATTALNFNSAASAILGQSDAGGGVISTGAVAPDAPLVVRPYSSQGPTNNGALKPDLVATDGVAVTGAGGFDGTFFGTSAAAPHAAAIAALLLDARPSLTSADGGNPAQERVLVRGLLLGNAVDLGAPGDDPLSGAGRIDAVAAIDAALDTVLTVTSAADSGPGTFRAAIQTLNDAAAAGENGGAIVFDAPRTISLESPLPSLDAGDVIISGAGSIIDGGALPGDGVGLEIHGPDVQVGDFTIRGFGNAGVWVRGASGTSLTELRLTANGDGLRIDSGATGVRVGEVDLRGVEATKNIRAGVVVAGAGTRDIHIQHSNIGVDRTGAAGANGGAGISIRDGARDTVVGAPLTSEAGPVVAQAAELAHTFLGTATINGIPASEGTLIEAFVDGEPAAATRIGALDVGGAPGFVFTLVGPGEEVTFAVAGTLLPDTFLFEPGATTEIALLLQRGPSGDEPTVLSGGNTIAFNRGGGVVVAGADTTGHTIRGNAIYGNTGLDVDLAAPNDPANGVTPDDAGDQDDGPNGLLNRPALTSIAFLDGLATIRGNSAAATIDLYAVVSDTAVPGAGPHASGRGGAVSYLATTVAIDGAFVFDNVDVGDASVLTALATDVLGNTSEFAVNLAIGPGPSIRSISPDRGSREGGSALTLNGDGFGDAQTVSVFVGGREATVVEGDAQRVTVHVPPGPVGAAPVVLVNPDGRFDAIFDAFTYVAARTVALRPGWNNVAWRGPELPLTAALESIAGGFDRVFAWDSEQQLFESFIVGAPPFVNTLTTLTPNAVVWIFVTVDVTIVWEQPLTAEPAGP